MDIALLPRCKIMKLPLFLLLALMLVTTASGALAQAYENGYGYGGGVAVPSAAGSAQLDSRMDALEAQVRELTGNLERSQYQNAQMKNQLERLSSDIELRFQQQSQQTAATPVPTASPAPVDNSLGSDEEAAPASTLAPAASGNPKTKTSGGPLSEDAAQSTYDDAFAKLRAADYANAEKGFTTFLQGSPNNKLAGNAQYWLGETYYVRGQYKEAAVAFAEGYQKYPKNSKAPDNLLKLAMSLGQLGSKDDACLTLGELKKNYPNAAPTIKSRGDAERVRLKCR